MALATFSPPGFEKDLTGRAKDAWSRDLGRLIDDLVVGSPRRPEDQPRPQFFNPLRVDLKPDAVRKAITWGAFPKKLTNLPAPDRWVQGEDRDQQEEYCEWSAEKDDHGQIVRAFFTSEVPAYFHRLANDSPSKLLALYRQHVSPDVQPSDLLTPSNVYRERNKWNARGAMHMVQQFNTHSAAVILVAQSTVLRTGNGGPVTNASDLIACGINADAERNSDPHIVDEVNTLARRHASISLDDPIGLYIDGLQTTGWVTPDQSDARDYWQITRGDSNHAMRAVYSVPADRGFTVSDIRIDGRAIESPSQIAEFIQIKVVGLAHEIGENLQDARRCPGDDAGAAEYVVSRHDFLNDACLACIARSDLVDRSPVAAAARRLGVAEVELAPHLDSADPLPPNLLVRAAALTAVDREELSRVSGLQMNEARRRRPGTFTLLESGQISTLLATVSGTSRSTPSAEGVKGNL